MMPQFFDVRRKFLHFLKMNEHNPDGWSYNPSAWSERLPIVMLAMIGFLVALYLALYQWGVFEKAWEPFFDDGSRRILNSSVSRLLPIPDAAPGAFGYLPDACNGNHRRAKRWKRMPWIVMVFGLAVGSALL